MRVFFVFCDLLGRPLAVRSPPTPGSRLNALPRDGKNSTLNRDCFDSHFFDVAHAMYAQLLLFRTNGTWHRRTDEIIATDTLDKAALFGGVLSVSLHSL